jgi:BirA family transcriptional regulator, biotin operon repressor / biotin---[acetyl-CoA-carboxylase] ligase
VSAPLSASAFRHEHLADIDSTNAELLRRAQRQSVHGLALSADFQSAGRGQRGRTWRAGRGDSVLLSVAWAFPKAQRIDGLSLAVGVAVCEAIDALQCGSGRPLLKWPNDLLLATPSSSSLGKLGGILIETMSIDNDQRIAVIGMGVNVVTPETTSTVSASHVDPTQELSTAALLSMASNSAEAIRERLIERLLITLSASLQQFRDHGFSAFRERWWQRRAFAEEPVQVLAPDGTTLHGRIAGLTEHGALVIDGVRGRHTLVSGTVSLRPLTL